MSTKKAAIENAEKVIERFGGIRPMASKINVPVTTIQGWKKRNVIPGTRRHDIESVAAELNIDLSDLMTGAPQSSASATTTSPVANENSQKEEKKSERKLAEKAEQNTITPERREAIKKGVEKHHNTIEQLAARDSSPPSSNEALLKSIEAGNRKTVVVTIWIVTALILLGIALASFFLWPSTNQLSQKLEQQEQVINDLKSNVKEVDKKTSLFGSINDLKQKAQSDLEALQNQARNTQIALEQISEKTSEISGQVLGADAGPLSQRLTMIEKQVATLSGGEGAGKLAGLIERIQKLEQSVPGQMQMHNSLSELKDIVGGLDGKVTTLEGALEQAQGDETALGQTLEGVSGNDLKAAAMLLAFSQLRDSLNREGPFEDDLALLNKMVSEDNVELKLSIAKLAPHANQGVLSTSGLSKEFKGLAGDIVVSSLKGEDISIKEKAMARFNDVIQVEKDGELLTGTDTQSTVNKAQAMLDAGDVQGAIATLQTLDGEAAETAQPFIEQAKASLLSGQVQQMLQSSILSKVSGPLGGVMNQVPKDLAGVTEESASSEGSTPAQSGFEASNVKDTLGNAVGGAVDTVAPKEVVKDEESGLAILPRQQGFKGFSTGQ